MRQTRTFLHEPESVPAARRFARSALRGVSVDTLNAVELMVSELATNCIRHADTGFEVTITRRGGEIRVDATDAAGGRPEMLSPKPTDPSGRGLKIVDMLSADWGVDRSAAIGKTVWFTVTDTDLRRRREPRGRSAAKTRGRTTWRGPSPPVLRGGVVPTDRGSWWHEPARGHDPRRRRPSHHEDIPRG